MKYRLITWFISILSIFEMYSQKSQTMPVLDKLPSSPYEIAQMEEVEVDDEFMKSNLSEEVYENRFKLPFEYESIDYNQYSRRHYCLGKYVNEGRIYLLFKSYVDVSPKEEFNPYEVYLSQINPNADVISLRLILSSGLEYNLITYWINEPDFIHLYRIEENNGHKYLWSGKIDLSNFKELETCR